MLPSRSKLDQLITGDTTPAAIHPAFGTSIRAVGNIADADASLHNSFEQDTDSALLTARRDGSVAIPISSIAESVAGCAAAETVPNWSVQWTSSNRQEISQLPTADDINDTDRTTKLATVRFMAI